VVSKTQKKVCYLALLEPVSPALKRGRKDIFDMGLHEHNESCRCWVRKKRNPHLAIQHFDKHTEKKGGAQELTLQGGGQETDGGEGKM